MPNRGTPDKHGPAVRRRRALAVLCALPLLFAGEGVPADEALLGLLARPGHVLILRHAQAPGFGDPEGFVLEDCATQRNLSGQGLAQARELGARLRAAGIGSARVYSSRWCRCLETARELGLGPVIPLPVLDSLFQQASDLVEERTAALRRFLAELEPGEPVVLVTHQANIRALTGRGTGSAGGAVLRVDARGEVETVGTI
jgi:broad specificity phosphatase PhoE